MPRSVEEVQLRRVFKKAIGILHGGDQAKRETLPRTKHLGELDLDLRLPLLPLVDGTPLQGGAALLRNHLDDIDLPVVRKNIHRLQPHVPGGEPVGDGPLVLRRIT